MNLISLFKKRLLLYQIIILCKIYLNHSLQDCHQNMCGNIIFAVKSTQKFHDTRLKILHDTWFQWCPNETYVFTDQIPHLAKLSKIRRLKGTLEEISTKPHVQILSTECRPSHDRSDLCCKTGAILETFVDIYISVLGKGECNIEWLCLFDDDNYVNIPALRIFLTSKDSLEPHYIGKSSIREPLMLPKLVNSKSHQFANISDKVSGVFNFATGGAGVCLSKSLVFNMVPYIKEKRFKQLCDITNLPDDVTLGYLIENLVGVKLTQIRGLNSHLDDLKLISSQELMQQLTLSYSIDPLNTISLRRRNLRSTTNDYTRFYNLHCLLSHNKEKYC